MNIHTSVIRFPFFYVRNQRWSAGDRVTFLFETHGDAVQTYTTSSTLRYVTEAIEFCFKTVISLKLYTNLTPYTHIRVYYTIYLYIYSRNVHLLTDFSISISKLFADYALVFSTVHWVVYR
jgi:hypothetical protein